jgi:hypothetical protein
MNKRISFRRKISYLFFMISMDNNTMIALWIELPLKGCYVMLQSET